MNTSVSWPAVTATWAQLTEEEQHAVVENPGGFKEFARDLALEIAKNTFFFPLSDNEVPPRLQDGRQIGHRSMAAELGYTGPVAWHVKEGFTLKLHAPKVGPCRENFQYLQDWNFPDPPSQNSLVWWIPRWIPEINEKNVKDQLDILASFRQRFSLPAHHLSGFGPASTLAGLILRHFKRTGERVPLGGNWVRTDTLDVDGLRLYLGGFGGFLRCGNWDWHDEYRYGNLGAFPLGVDLLETGELAF